MTDRLRATRDSINKGDEVLVAYHGVNQLSKPRRAKVVESMRAACRVKFVDNNEERTVQFKYLTRVEEVEPMPILTPPKIAPVLNLPTLAPTAPKTQLDVWLEMGYDLAGEMQAGIAMLEAEGDALEETSKRLLEDSKQLLKESEQALVEAKQARENAAQDKKRLDQLHELAGMANNLTRKRK